MKLLNKSFVSPSAVILLLRIILGAVFIYHGSQKVLGIWGGYGLEATVQGFGQSGIIAPLAYLASFTEFLGGFAMIFGALTRVFSLGLAVVMIVAILKVHLPQGFGGYEFNLALLTLALSIFLYGPGDYSIDKKLNK
ncbi:MAG TPA: DoxX family protein [Ignavibacteriales bacterium]|nr:DoxX family protein [Ignavibacteriales bacterium]